MVFTYRPVQYFLFFFQFSSLASFFLFSFSFFFAFVFVCLGFFFFVFMSYGSRNKIIVPQMVAFCSLLSFKNYAQ